MRFLAALLALSSLPAFAAGPADAQPVYFWPMRDAFDQYIAEAVAAESVLSVTVDPKLAKSVMTERIDADFLAAMDDLFPRDEPEAEQEEAAEKKASDASIEGNFQLSRPKNRPLGRPRGTIFLVDVETRRVIWSTFLGDRDTQAKNLHKEAQRVVDRLEKAVTPSS